VGWGEAGGGGGGVLAWFYGCNHSRCPGFMGGVQLFTTTDNMITYLINVNHTVSTIA
jgi:hypothetical protein